MKPLLFAAAFLTVSGCAWADDDMGGMDMSGMEGMNMSGMAAMSGLLGSYPMSRDASGTSWQPDAATHKGIHLMAGAWSFMAHGMLNGVYDTQNGPRGNDGVYLLGWAMGEARRNFGADDTLAFRAMLSPDAFAGKRGYPMLLQTGETADGTTPLHDRQHPHDLFMELAATYAHHFSQDDSAFVYFGYPGEPALGPTAFMHRASAVDMPVAPISHHWLDSTHIAFGVVTAGYVHDDVKLEVSQFTGREPDQYRFDFDAARFDSTAVRATWNPDAHWSLQASYGSIKSPEQLTPNQNELRYTASATYVLPLGDDSSWSSTLAFGRKHLTGGAAFNAWLLETEYKPDDAWTAYGRAETVETDELFPSGAKFSVGEVTLGGIHDWRLAQHLKFGLGAQFTFDFAPQAPVPSYGSDPHGVMGFARLVVE